MPHDMIAVRLGYRDLLLKQPSGRALPQLEVVVNGLTAWRMQHRATTGLCFQRQDEIEFRLKYAGKNYRAQLNHSSIPDAGKKQTFEWINLQEVEVGSHVFRKASGYPKLLIQLTKLGKGQKKKAESFQTIDQARFEEGFQGSSIIDRIESFERKLKEQLPSTPPTYRQSEPSYERLHSTYNRQDPFDRTHHLTPKLPKETFHQRLQFYQQHQLNKSSALKRIFDTFEGPGFAAQPNPEHESHNTSTFTLY